MIYEISENSVFSTKKGNKYSYHFLNGNKIGTADKFHFTCTNCNKNTSKIYVELLKRNFQLLCSKCLKQKNYINIWKDKDLCIQRCIKSKKTCLEKYGVDNPMKIKSIVEKTFKTKLERYGYENSFQDKEIRDRAMIKIKTDEVKKKRENTNMKKYGYKNNFQSPQSKKTLMDRYGVEYNMHVDKFARKASMNSHNTMKMRIYSSKFGELYYQSTPELKLIQYCEEKNIEIKNGPILDYIFENKNRKYYVDFETNNYIVEIKSSHKWYYEDLKSGKLDLKNNVAENYALSLNKKFLFILDDIDFQKYLGAKNGV